MKKRVFVFPGQGSQVVGMGADFRHDAAGRALFEAADEAIGFNLSRLMLEGPAEELTLTQNAQPALLVTGLAALDYLLRQAGKPVAEMASFVAGHSLGEYTAVAAAGGLSLDDAVRLVRVRGMAMSKAEGGGMSAILGLEPAIAEKVAAQNGVVLANDNAVGQVIFSGPLDALTKAEEAAKVAGAKRCLRLNVSGPFHTPAMRGAAEAVRDELAQMGVKDLQVGCMMNASAKVEMQSAVVAEGLVAQVTGRIRWREGMMALAEMGVEEVVELGVGKVLSGLASRCDARLTGVSLDSRAAVDAWLEANQ
jgi:[acyl-carrier-protein] S-malonyltransferase